MPASLIVKSEALSIGCLSLIDYLPHPDPTKPRALRSQVRAALGVQHGAPEIPFWILGPSPLDPWARWLIGGIRLWFLVKSCPDGDRLLKGVTVGKRNSRLSAVHRECCKVSWKITHNNIRADNIDRDISLAGEWATVRPIVITYLRLSVFHELAKRRPATYEGLEGLDIKRHQKLIKKSSPYHAALLMKLWGGAVMTRAFRHRMHKDTSPACDCGHDWQDTRHVLYECPLVSRPFFSLSGMVSTPSLYVDRHALR